MSAALQVDPLFTEPSGNRLWQIFPWMVDHSECSSDYPYPSLLEPRRIFFFSDCHRALLWAFPPGNYLCSVTRPQEFLILMLVHARPLSIHQNYHGSPYQFMAPADGQISAVFG